MATLWNARGRYARPRLNAVITGRDMRTDSGNVVLEIEKKERAVGERFMEHPDLAMNST